MVTTWTLPSAGAGVPLGRMAELEADPAGVVILGAGTDAPDGAALTEGKAKVNELIEVGSGTCRGAIRSLRRA